MAESGPDYTLRRPVDVNTPLPVIFHEDEEDIGGYFVQEDGIATKHRPQPTKASKVRFSLSLCPFSLKVLAGL